MKSFVSMLRHFGSVLSKNRFPAIREHTDIPARHELV
jgi:hypothetical protein